MTAGQLCVEWLEYSIRGDVQYGSFSSLREP
jgi:hypothetical protein